MASNNEIETRYSVADDKGVIHSKKEKAEFQDFLIALKNAVVAHDKKNKVPKIYQLIKKGFKGEVKAEHIDEIFQVLSQEEYFSHLTMRIAIETAVGRPGAVVKKLIVPMRGELAGRISFPIARARNFFDNGMKDAVEDWIAKKSSEGPLDPLWVRSAFICIMRENMSGDEFAIIHSIVESCLSGNKTTSRKKGVVQPGKYTSYIRRVGSLFTSAQFKPSRFFLDICRPLGDELKRTRRKAADLNAQLELEKSNSCELEKSLKSVKQELAGAQGEIQRLQGEIQGLQQEVMLKEQTLRDEQERFRMLDAHWKRQVVHESQGKIYALKKYFQHEVQEARLSLDRENPNVDMALNRIGHIEEYLNQIGENV